MTFSLPPSQADPESWALVTAFKAASSYVGDLLDALFKARGVPHVDLAGFAFANGHEEATFCVEHQALLRSAGYYFGPFRDAYIADMPVLRDIKVVAHIRDPRDCLVSNHFSLAFSHVIPADGPARDELLANRQLYAGRSVDQSVLADCDQFERIFANLRDLDRSRGDVYVSRYEDMVTDFADWLDRLCLFIRCDQLTAVKDALKHQASFAVQENQFSHKRQVVPGDFRRKLTPETQRSLTERMRSVLTHFGYDCTLENPAGRAV